MKYTYPTIAAILIILTGISLYLSITTRTQTTNNTNDIAVIVNFINQSIQAQQAKK